MRSSRILLMLTVLVGLLAALPLQAATGAIASSSSTWTQQASGNFIPLLYSIDANTGWAIDTDARSAPAITGILRTTNGGRTWARLPAPGSLLQLFFIDPLNGWGVGRSDGEEIMHPADANTVFRTTDGGITWTSCFSGPLKFDPAQDYYFRRMYFLDSQHGWVVGAKYDAQGTPRLFVLTTDDGGSSWTSGTIDIRSLYPGANSSWDILEGVRFVDENVGWAVGWWMDAQDNHHQIIVHTTDGGRTWKAQGQSTEGFLNAVDFIDSNTGWAVGTNIRHTTNGGATWTEQQSPEGGLTSVRFFDSTHGWAGTLSTTNGGSTWTKNLESAATGVWTAYFSDFETGWGAGDDPTNPWIGMAIFRYWAPHLSTTISDLPMGWVTHDVPFSLTATDPLGPGLANTYYRVSPPGGVVASTEGTVTTEGTTTIAYWSVEAWGMFEPTCTAVVRMDKTPPATSSDATAAYLGTGRVHFTVVDPVSGPATTRFSVDGGEIQTGMVASVPASGTHTLEFAGMDVAGNADSTHTATFTVTPRTYDEVAGPWRFDTAAEASKRAYPAAGSADTIVLATGRYWSDALGGSALAGAVDGPLLLTEPGFLSQQVIDEARRLDVHHVMILGGNLAVKNAVEQSLRTLDVNGHPLDVSRVGGKDRFETSALIASATVDAIKAKGGTYDGTAFFATARNFPDELAASPISAKKHWPILLVAGFDVPPPVASAVVKLGISRGIILGGEAAVGSQAEANLASLLPVPPERLGGSNRYITAVDIARFSAANGLQWNGIAIATGENYPDALTGGVMQAKLGSVVLLEHPSIDVRSVLQELGTHRNDIASVTYLGSTNALPSEAREDVYAALELW